MIATVVAVVAAASMLLGNLAALPQTDIRRLMAYSGVAHTGYVLVAVAALSSGVGNAAGSAVFYAVAYAVPSLAIMLVAAEEGVSLDRFGQLAARRPVVAWSVVLLLLSLIGIPPLVGFFGKLYVFGSAIDGGPRMARGLRRADERDLGRLLLPHRALDVLRRCARRRSDTDRRDRDRRFGPGASQRRSGATRFGALRSGQSCLRGLRGCHGGARCVRVRAAALRSEDAGRLPPSAAARRYRPGEVPVRRLRNRNRPWRFRRDAHCGVEIAVHTCECSHGAGTEESEPMR